MEAAVEITTQTVTAASTIVAIETILTETLPTTSYSSYVLRLPFIVISIPYYVYYILTYTLTLTLDIYSFSIILTILASIAYYLFRFKYLAFYSRLPINPPLVGNPFDLHPNTTLPIDNEVQEDYMTLFLGSIKVFGYLDRPVFHELARQMEIKKCEKGEVIFCEDKPTRDFIVVVEGTVELFVKCNTVKCKMSNIN